MARRSVLLAVLVLGWLGGLSCVPKVLGPTPLVREERTPGAMGYRIFLPPNVKDKRPRVAVWLHPENSSGLDLVEPLAPLLVKHGYALVAPLDKDWRAWTSDQVTELFGRVLPEAVVKHGLSPEQPLLLGFSAGGQMALHLWHTAPEEFAGLVLVATAPMLVARGAMAEVTFPDAWRYAGTPILSIVGERDPSSARWRAVLDPWKREGVKVDFKQVPNVDHTWCVGAFERERLDTWLDGLGAP